MQTGAFGLANWTGLVATLILAMLLALSNDLSIRRLGRHRWKTLQRLNYVFFALVMIHAFLYQSVESRTAAPVALCALLGLVVVSAQLVGFRATRMARPGRAESG